MDYSTWSLMSSSSLDVAHSNTLRLFDDAPVKIEAPPPPPPPGPSNNDLLRHPNKIWHKEETGALVEELNRVNAENKRLTEMLTVVCENYNDLKRQLVDYMMTNNNKTSSSNNAENKKRKITDNNNQGAGAGESSSSDEEEDSYQNNNKPNNNKEETIKAKITRVAVRTQASDSSLILKDGYQWRKYGQKVTRDNPCPRAYFKCSFAPTCPVKKKVQRSLEDQSMLVATYEGEHNHAPPPQQLDRDGTTATAPSSRSFSLGASNAAAVTLDLTTNNNKVHHDDSTTTLTKISSPEFQKLLADQMASTLTKDPNFTAALAAAITGRFVHHT